MGPTPCYLQSQVVSACSSIPFSEKNTFFFLNQKGVRPYRYANGVPLVTLIPNIYGFVGLALSFFWQKYHFFAFFKYRKGCGHIDLLMTFPW